MGLSIASLIKKKKERTRTRKNEYPSGLLEKGISDRETVEDIFLVSVKL